MTLLINWAPPRTPNNSGVVLALYATDALYDFEIQRAPDVAGAPGTWATIAAAVDGSTEIFIDQLPANGALYWYQMRHTGFGDTPSPWTAAVSATAGPVLYTPSRPPAPKLTLRNLRQIARTATTVTFQWDRDPRQDAVDVWETTVVGPLAGSPWPEPDPVTGLYPAPLRVLADTTTTVTFTVPTDGVLYVMVLPRDAKGKPGLLQRWAITAVGVRPLLYGLTQNVGASGLFTSISFYIADAQTLGGTLTAWVNHDSSANADSSGPADGTVVLASTPTLVDQSTAWNKGSGGTGALLSNIRVHPGRGKSVTFEFVNTLGVSSGKQEIMLTSQGGIIDENGVLVDGAILTAKAFATTFRPPQPVTVLPADNTLYGDMVVLTTDRKLYQWVGGAWVVNNAPAITLLNTLYGGAGVFGVVDSVAIKASSVLATHIAVAVLSDIASNVGIILAGKLQSINGSVIFDLNATGTNPVFSSPYFALNADGSASFSGVVAASSFTASTATFKNHITIGGLSVVYPTSLSFGDLVALVTPGTAATLTSKDYTNTRGVGLSVAGALYTGIVDVATDLYLPGGRVSYGAANSGGAGFRLVLVPN